MKVTFTDESKLKPIIEYLTAHKVPFKRDKDGIKVFDYLLKELDGSLKVFKGDTVVKDGASPEDILNYMLASNDYTTCAECGRLMYKCDSIFCPDCTRRHIQKGILSHEQSEAYGV